MNAAFVAAMEDVLDVYAEPYNPERPVVCFDETPKQLVAETRTPLPPRAGQVERYDYEYQRNGTCNLFMFLEPLRGWRHVELTAQRTQIDFAHQMRWLVDVAYPQALTVRVVLDNLNTHTAASLYEAFAPVEARRLLKRLEFHHTPKHGSWLNMAELELSVFQGMCWDRRIPDTATLAAETRALEEERNAKRATVTWRFTTPLAREKMGALYPSIPD